MPSELHIFDFDGTLFRSPTNTPENQRKYEQKTGIPWIVSKALSRELSAKHGKFVPMRSGWFGRVETLEPPLVPDPAPPEWFIKSSVDALQQSRVNPDAVTLVMTGRHTGLKNAVLRICEQGQIFGIEKKNSKDKVYYEVSDPNVRCHFLGDNGPVHGNDKPGETLPWKLWIAEQYLELYPEIKKIIFWEDRLEHVESFRELHGVLVEEVVVNHVI